MRIRSPSAARTTRPPLRFWRLTKPALSAMLRGQLAPITRFATGWDAPPTATGATAGTPVPYVTGYAAVAPFFGGPKNSVSGPGNWRLNASMFKDFRTFHEQYLEFRADAFNILNHPSLGNPGSTSTDIGANVVRLPGQDPTRTSPSMRASSSCQGSTCSKLNRCHLIQRNTLRPLAIGRPHCVVTR